ncbi:MAG: hypothetical protein L0241_12565 [Planctomycetia bacterium]|nr:hypothetical protein [Planctomycetia bacterium]
MTLKTPNRVPVGKSVKCPKCTRTFVPEPAEDEKESLGSALNLSDEPGKKGKTESTKSDPAPAAKKPLDDEEDSESVKKGYGVAAETEAEKKEAEKNKPKFKDVKEKFKKSARGPAMSLLVMPSNLLTLEGLLTCAAGIGLFIVGMWPLVFNDAPPGEEETEEAVVYMMLGMVTIFWGSMVCFCAAQMQELGSYAWAMTGAVMGIAPLLTGIYAIVMLQNPKVKAGFEEGEFVDEDEEGGDDDDEDDDDEDDDDDGGGASKGKGKKQSTGRKLAGRLGRGLLGAALGGGDDDEGGDEEEEEADQEDEEEVEEEEEEEEEMDEDEEEEEDDDDGKKKRRKKRK